MPARFVANPRICPRELIEQPKIRYSEELAGIRVFRSAGTPFFHIDVNDYPEGNDPKEGEFYRCRITAAHDYDLVAEIV